MRPRAPAGTPDTSASNPAWSRPNRSRAHSSGSVQLSTHASGSQPPVESQNAETSRRGSIAGAVACPNTVPDVPRLITATPGTTAPTPIAAHMLSPPPTETGIPAGRPSASARLGAQRAQHRARLEHRRQRRIPVAGVVDGRERGRGVGARAHVEVRRAGRVAGLGRERPGEPEIQVVVREPEPARLRVRAPAPRAAATRPWARCSRAGTRCRSRRGPRPRRPSAR